MERLAQEMHRLGIISQLSERPEWCTHRSDRAQLERSRGNHPSACSGDGAVLAKRGADREEREDDPLGEQGEHSPPGRWRRVR